AGTCHAGACITPSIAGATNTACGLSQDGTIQCWGGTDWGVVANAPPSVSRFSEVSLRESIACALKLDHTIQCWGNADPNNSGMLGWAPRTHVHELAVGNAHGCALRDSDNRLTCW